ncbi:hypothetical protein [Herbaspirillum sp. SJZ107]|uniref:hypothetical protein n=1 Tax=Herbaspirillum sp. SJZ107 TaxID=2572881 RepID=UPI00114F2139|nr:hypothetical protein [Herbaspirillum sp. SJZ107]TQK10843.1 hypothetical protein FBX97_0768 [Herbaspirillum sp. SJZ107]
MTTRMPRVSQQARVEREVERERSERSRNDEQRAGLAVDEDFRIKDARENMSVVNLKRTPGR